MARHRRVFQYDSFGEVILSRKKEGMNADSCVLFCVCSTCPRLCRSGRDSNMLAERELSQFVRKLMCFVYPPSVIPAEFEVRALLTPVDSEYATVDEGLYKLHFGQYFRYDVRTQLPFFYRSVQKLLGVVCREVTGA